MLWCMLQRQTGGEVACITRAELEEVDAAAGADYARLDAERSR